MSEALREAVWAKLTAVQTAGTFYDDLGGRIYGVEAPQNAALPLCVVTLVTSPVEQTFNETDLRSATFQIDLYGLRTGGAENLGDINTKLFALLQNAELTVTGQDRGVVTCVDEGAWTMEEDAVRILSEWQVESGQFS